MREVDSLRLELAAYYCDDEATFQLDDAYRIIRTFCDKLQKAVKVSGMSNVYIISLRQCDLMVSLLENSRYGLVERIKAVVVGL